MNGLIGWTKHTEVNMNINDEFPSNYLKASDLKGKKITVTIDRVEKAEFDQGKSKPVVFFTGKEKGLVLNKTNAMIISSAHGPETDGWKGKEVILYSAKVPFQGQMTDALRVEIPQTMADPDDPIPFIWAPVAIGATTIVGVISEAQGMLQMLA